MRAALHLLLIVCVLWCATGIGAPVAASACHDAPYETTVDAEPERETGGDAADPGGSMHHHHCPVAPDLARGVEAAYVAAPGSVPVLPRIGSLTSLTRVPPLHPPAIA